MERSHPPAWVLLGATLVLFAVWSNSFVAIAYLLGREGAPARFDWASLTVARFLPAAAIAALYSFGLRRRESLAMLRAHKGRLFACGMLGIPVYNFALYYGQQHGVPAPIASLTTALAPLFLLILGRILFGERITRRRVLGFCVALAGLLTIAAVPGRSSGTPYPLLLAITALAPLSWSLYSVLGKPASSRSPILWTFLSIVVGSLPLVLLLPFHGARELAALDARGSGALLFLSLGCTVFGFFVWNWLLHHLPASTVGLSVFLNPPLTTLSKLVLNQLFPASFVFLVVAQEWIGGAIVLAGLANALVRYESRPARARPRQAA